MRFAAAVSFSRDLSAIALHSFSHEAREFSSQTCASCCARETVSSESLARRLWHCQGLSCPGAGRRRVWRRPFAGASLRSCWAASSACLTLLSTSNKFCHHPFLIDLQKQLVRKQAAFCVWIVEKITIKPPRLGHFFREQPAIVILCYILLAARRNKIFFHYIIIEIIVHCQ